jgi:hypothetical protein
MSFKYYTPTLCVNHIRICYHHLYSYPSCMSLHGCKVTLETFDLISKSLKNRTLINKANVILTAIDNETFQLICAPNKIFEFNRCRYYDPYIQEGKVSLMLTDQSCTILISQANINELIEFRRILLRKASTDVCKSVGDNKENICNISSQIRGRIDTKPLKSNYSNNFRKIPTERFCLKPSSDISVSSITTPAKHSSVGLKDSPVKYSPLLKHMKANTPLKIKPLSSQQLICNISSTTSIQSPRLPSTELSVQQHAIIAACLAGSNVFYSGGAGTGKSYLLQYIIQALIAKKGKHSVFVTATTGLRFTPKKYIGV